MGFINDHIAWMYNRFLRKDFHDRKRFCVIDGHRLSKGVRSPDIMMDIVNRDAEDTNLLTLLIFRQHRLSFYCQRSGVQFH